MIVLKKWMLLVLLLLVMALTVPGAARHSNKIKSQVSQDSGHNVMNDIAINYSDYRLLSVARVDEDVKSIGVLGMVFLVEPESVSLQVNAE